MNKLAYAYNTSQHATTGFTPFEIQFGRKPKMPLDLIIENPNEDDLGRHRRLVTELTVGEHGCVVALADCDGLYHKELPLSAKIYVRKM